MATRKKKDEEAEVAQADAEANANLSDDDAYVGVSPEYKNSAFGVTKPLRSEDPEQAAVEQAAADREKEQAERNAKVGFRGYDTSSTPHPSEAKQPASGYVERNRTLMEAAEAEAKEHLEQRKTESPIDV